MYTLLNGSAQLFLAGLERTNLGLAQATQQLSSGLRINVASDAPDQVSMLLQLRAVQQSNAQVQSNLTLAKTDASTADTTLGGAATLMDTAVQLGTQGANFTLDASGRAALAEQVQGLLEQMVNYSQTQVNGRYIFSGDLPGSPTYQLDLAAPTGVDQITNAAATQQIKDPAGGSFPAALTAQQIFGDTNPDGTPAADNAFNALNTLLVALQNNDQAGVAASIPLIQQASDHLNNMNTFYGTVENRIQSATTFATNFDLQLQTQIGNIQDANAPAAATALTQDNTNLQVAMQAEAKQPTTSLFSFLA
jgi:flagellar hook-associated protein 3 FlgL